MTPVGGRQMHLVELALREECEWGYSKAVITTMNTHTELGVKRRATRMLQFLVGRGY
jgi:hypothetical protein